MIEHFKILTFLGIKAPSCKFPCVFKVGHAHGGLGKVKVETEAAYQVRKKLKAFLVYHHSFNVFYGNNRELQIVKIILTKYTQVIEYNAHVQFAILFINNVHKDLHRILQVWWLYQDNMSQLRIMWRLNMISIYSKLVTSTELLGN